MKKATIALGLSGLIIAGSGAGFSIGSTIATNEEAAKIEQLKVQTEMNREYQYKIANEIAQMRQQQKQMYHQEAVERKRQASAMVEHLNGASLDTTSEIFRVTSNDGNSVEGRSFDNPEFGMFYQTVELEPYGLADVEPGDYISIRWKTSDYEAENWDQILSADDVKINQ